MADASIDGLALLGRLPEGAATLIDKTAEVATSQGARAFLVGGIVRDLILGRPSLDLDLVVEGDAIALARSLASAFRGRLIAHVDFSTATLYVNSMVVDVATARTETYPRPGALPVVKATGIAEDLRRRDFSINAIALALNGPAKGMVLDPSNGLADLQAGLVRVLHDRSFIDDATRMLRGVRYEQRFQFRLESATEALVRRDAGMLGTVSGERLRYELERGLDEERREAIFTRMAFLGLLKAIYPALELDERKAVALRHLPSQREERYQVGAAILTLGLDEWDVRAVAGRLSFPKPWTATALDAHGILDITPQLQDGGLPVSGLYALLKDFCRPAIQAVLAASPSAEVGEALRHYLEVLSTVQPALTGRDILALGVPQGPAVGEALAALRAAVLDRAVVSKEDEIAFVHWWLSTRGEGGP